MNQSKAKVYYYVILAMFGLLFAGCPLAADGQDMADKPELKFQRIHEGLLSNQISTLFQDQRGYIWVGTYSGLHRYDGIQFQIYTATEEKNTINSNFIGTIYEDENRNLWIGTGSGVSRYNRVSDDFTNYTFSEEGSSESNIVNTIFEDENGVLWAAGGMNGIYYFDEEQQQFKTYGDFSDYAVNQIIYQGNNIFWIATIQNGLIKFNSSTEQIEETFTHDPSDPESISSSNISALEIDSDGNLWAGTRGSGLNRMVIKDGETTFRRYRHQPGDPHSLFNNDIFTMYVDRSGKLWVGNENGGLHLYDKQTDSFYRYESDADDPNSLSHNSIWSFYQDRQGRYWVGTGLTGINISDPYATKFTHYRKSGLTEGGLNNDIIRDFLETKQGDIWIATDGGGLNYFDRDEKSFTAFTHDPDNPNSIGSDAVVDLSKSEDGEVWVGTWAGGGNILTDSETGSFMTIQQKLNDSRYSFRNVFDVHFDDEYDYIWIASFGEGLVRYNQNSGTLDVFNPDSEENGHISSNFITRIYEDSNHNIWLATNNGLNLLKSEHKQKGVFHPFFNSENDSMSVPSNSIRQIYEDSRRNVWFATTNGLAKFEAESESFITYDASDGLPSDEIESIVEDDSGNLWIGTIRGLSKLDPQEMTFRNYDKSDGLQSNEFSRYAAYKLDSGELLFGGMNGFNIFHPDSIRENPNKPPVYFSDFKLFNRSVNIGDENSPLDEHISVADTVQLNHTQSVFTFEFIALNYTMPEQNRYAYKMEGFEDQWNYVGNQRNATYTNLDPGTYTFRVKASNNDDVWNEQGASLTLIILPPFWQTTWFYLLAALFVIGVGVTAYQFRVRSITQQNKRLEKEVENRTSELKEKNKDLQNAMQDLKTTRSKLVQKAHKAGMADLATGVLHNVGNILNSINTSTNQIEEILINSNLSKFKKANDLLDKHRDNIEDFLLNNPKGEKLLEYYPKLEEALEDENEELKSYCDRLTEKVRLIIEVIEAQQNFSKVGRINEEVRLERIVVDTIKLQSGSIERHGLTIEKDFGDTEEIVVQKSKLIHILVNLLNNAKEAMENVEPEKRTITIKTYQDEDNVYLSVSDNGSGIKSENRKKIFKHGFTTKKKGHGYGLHTCANYMAEMGGKISVKSKSEREGATFNLAFPKNGLKEQKKDPEGVKTTST